MNESLLIPLAGQFLGLVSIIGLFYMVIKILQIDFKKRELLSQEILTAIEKGADIPLPQPKERNFRNQGIVWSFIGLSFIPAVYVSSGVWAGAIWGIVPLAVGIALLLIHWFQEKEKADA